MTTRELGIGETSWFAKQLSKPGVRRAFDEDRASYEFGAQLSEALLRKGITRAELAKRIGKSRPYVTQVLRDGHNLTIRTMTELASAAGFGLHVMLFENEGEGGPIYVEPGPCWGAMNVTMTEQVTYKRTSSMTMKWGHQNPTARSGLQARDAATKTAVEPEGDAVPPSTRWLSP